MSEDAIVDEIVAEAVEAKAEADLLILAIHELLRRSRPAASLQEILTSPAICGAAKDFPGMKISLDVLISAARLHTETN